LPCGVGMEHGLTRMGRIFLFAARREGWNEEHA
jgi:hypothetical protein